MLFVAVQGIILSHGRVTKKVIDGFFIRDKVLVLKTDDNSCTLMGWATSICIWAGP